MKMLNLGCGTKTTSSPEVINIDWSPYLLMRRHWVSRTLAPWLLSGERLERFRSLPDNIRVHNLAKGLPFASDSIDVVYHSHLLEHLDRDVARVFQLEIKRVLRPGGIQRIVVPDLQRICEAYLSHIALCEHAPHEAANHDAYVEVLIEQCVRREAFGASQQPPTARLIENAILGDARRRGETHQWMYDRVSLSELLVSLGFRSPHQEHYNTSMIPNWNDYGLDLDAEGGEYKAGSLYIEAQK